MVKLDGRLTRATTFFLDLAVALRARTMMSCNYLCRLPVLFVVFNIHGFIVLKLD